MRRRRSKSTRRDEPIVGRGWKKGSRAVAVDHGPGMIAPGGDMHCEVESDRRWMSAVNTVSQSATQELLTVGNIWAVKSYYAGSSFVDLKQFRFQPNSMSLGIRGK